MPTIKALAQGWKWKTWHFENALVIIVLSSVAIATGGSWIEWVGAIGVFAGFCCSSIGERMREREASRLAPSVECHKMWTIFYWTKEVAWLTYFIALHAWSALVGCAIGVGYPLWRVYWRKIHPMQDSHRGAIEQACKRYIEDGSVLELGESLAREGIPKALIETVMNLHIRAELIRKADTP